MASFRCNFYSNALQMWTSMSVVIPRSAEACPGADGGDPDRLPPVLYLLHGLSDDDTIWMRRTSIERYAEAKGIAVVMPAVQRSFYTDMAQGLKYWTFVSEELPEVVDSFFKVRTDRESTFVAGLSMGGYGAFKLALSCPERFAAGASLSGATDMRNVTEDRPEERGPEMEWIFGEQFEGTANDLFYLADQLAASDGPKPRLFQCCGTEDFLIEGNRSFRDHAEKLGLDLHYEEGPGDHLWSYWDEYIQKVLDWLPVHQGKTE